MEDSNYNSSRNFLNPLKIILIIFVITILSVLLIINKNTIFNISQSQNKAPENVNPKYKLEVSNFKLKDVYGDKVSLSDYKGKIIFVTFWASWCESCLFEMPVLSEVNNAYKDKDVVFLAISVMETETTIGNFVDAYNYGLKFLLDLDGEVSKKYKVNGYPTTFVIDKNGQLYDKKEDSLDKDYLVNTISKLQ